jgi:pyrroloquinoline quinone biosynthesis protein E
MKNLFRAEAAYLMVYNLRKSCNMKISGSNLALLSQWLKTGEVNNLVQRLSEADLININMTDQEKEDLNLLIAQCAETKAPLRSMHTPEIMNIELTTRCPLRCPQCYCDLHQGKDIKKEVALKYIEQAAKLKIPFINLSGGETLVYPHLMELLKYISIRGLSSAIAISGWGFDSAKLAEIKNAGINEIYVSLNGSTEEINAKSRDGYDKAINALQLLQDDQQVDYYINWVARNDNVGDFPNLVLLAQRYGVKGIVILEQKPDASYVMQATLSKDNFGMLAAYLKQHDQQQVCITVEPCFSPLRAYINNYYLLNRNIGVNKGCGAGRNSMAVDVDGNLIPCRHLLYPEKYDSIEDYWWHSEVLNQLRSFEDHQQEPCQSCYLNKNCISCRAVAGKVEKNLFSGNNYCSVRVMEE